MVRWSQPLFVLASLLCAVCCRGQCGGGEQIERRPDSALRGATVPSAEETSHVDPYCGMRLRPGEAAATTTYRGTTYYFCLTDHMEAFTRDPERYLSERVATPPERRGEEDGGPENSGPECSADAGRESQ